MGSQVGAGLVGAVSGQSRVMAGLAGPLDFWGLAAMPRPWRQLPGLLCPCCGTVTFAEAPPGVHAGAVSCGPVLNAAAVLLSGACSAS